jgi:purine-nucleoside phosphorylase
MDSPVLIRPRRRKGEPDLPKTAVLALIREDLEFLKALAGKTERVKVRDFFKVHLADEGRLCLAGPALGAPQAVMVAEKLFALGVERLLFTGWAGSLRPEIKIGDLLLIKGALSEEGTSNHYPLEEEPRSNHGLRESLLTQARKQGLELKPGRIWTTDAIYRETREKVESYARQGLSAVDMETSALLTVAAFRGKAAAGLMIISDELGSGKWKPGFKSDRFQKARIDAAGLLLRSAQG